MRNAFPGLQFSIDDVLAMSAPTTSAPTPARKFQFRARNPIQVPVPGIATATSPDQAPNPNQAKGGHNSKRRNNIGRPSAMPEAGSDRDMKILTQPC
jgi:hypothetical protein